MSGKNGDGIKDEVDFGVPCSHRKKKCKFDFNPTTFKVELSSSDMGQAKNTQKK